MKPRKKCHPLPSLPRNRRHPLGRAEAKTSKRIHTISGRVAQLDMNLRSTCDDLTSLNDSLKRLTKTVESLPQGSEERVAAERSLYQAQLVMKGTGPAGALDGCLKPPATASSSLLMGNAVDVTSQRQENRLRIKEEYYSFRDRSTFTYVAWPTVLLYLNRERQKGLEAGAANTWFSLVTVFPVLVQFYWCWMLYFYAGAQASE